MLYAVEVIFFFAILVSPPMSYRYGPIYFKRAGFCLPICLAESSQQISREPQSLLLLMVTLSFRMRLQRSYDIDHVSSKAAGPSGDCVY